MAGPGGSEKAMSMSSWRDGRSAGGLLCAMVVLGPMTLAACGSVAAPGSSAAANAARPGGTTATAAGRAAPAGLALCANPETASRVVISRSATLRQIQPDQSLPPVQAVVSAPALVRALAKALCAVPRTGKGVFNCPALFKGSLKLRFTAAGRPLPLVTIQESGCEIVTGIGPARSVSKSPAFWTVLARAVGPAASALPVFLPGYRPPSECQPVSDRTLGYAHCPARARPGG
jgi:hypothetical protein